MKALHDCCLECDSDDVTDSASSISDVDMMRTVRRILVIDDSSSCRKMIIKLLSLSGHLCVEAESVQAGIDVISKMMNKTYDCSHHEHEENCDSGNIDVVLIDNHMPIMSGKVMFDRNNGFCYFFSHEFIHLIFMYMASHACTVLLYIFNFFYTLQQS